jgi:hypothetical protein
MMFICESIYPSFCINQWLMGVKVVMDVKTADALSLIDAWDICNPGRSACLSVLLCSWCLNYQFL